MNNSTTAQNSGNSIRYSRGRDKFDNQPAQHTAEDFNDFRAKVLADRSPSKGMAYIAAGMSFGPHDDRAKYPDNAHYRLTTHAENRRYVPLDFDGFAGCEQFGATREFISQYNAFIYTTASHTEESPRARAVIELNREVSREEGMRVGMAFQAKIENAVGAGQVKFDESVYRAEQPCYTPVTNSQVWSYDGMPLNVDLLLVADAGERPSSTQSV